MSQNNLSLQAQQFVRKGEKHNFNDFINILRLCIFAYSILEKNKEISNDLDEDTLSNKLSRVMQGNKGAFKLGFYHFEREGAEINEKDKTVGYNDIRAIIPNASEFSNNSEVFRFECKIFDGYATKNTLYIEEGIKRFFDCKYSPNMNLGGMIGYIRDCPRCFPEGIVNYIVKDINSKLVNKYNRREEEKLAKIDIEENFENSFKSNHSRIGVNVENIDLYHLLLKCS